MSFCALGEGVSCDTVARSEWSVALGVPVAVWGIAGYASALGLAGLSWLRPSRAALAALAALSLAFLLVSAGLGSVSTFAIGSLCVLCLGTYATNLALAGLVGGVLLRVGARRSTRALTHWLRCRWPVSALGLGTAIAATGVLSLVFPRYWEVPSVDAEPTSGVKPAVAGLTTGRTPDGHPWIGATEPTITIVEFSDYECPFCRKAHQRVRALVAAHAHRVRLVHRHYPLDSSCNPHVGRPFHRGACRLAALASCAAEQGRFWEVNDALYERSQRDATEADLADRFQLDLPALQACVARETAALRRELSALSVKVPGTPSFLVDGELHVGGVPDSVARRLGGASSAPSSPSKSHELE